MFEARYAAEPMTRATMGRGNMEASNSFPRSSPSNALIDRSEGSDHITEEDRAESFGQSCLHIQDFGTSSDNRLESSREQDQIPPMDISKIDKRKMKRFRLTHNQTRYLMSEFARQAHPDAAHRERLSREIPGLSPRQVQVWFQNRRAKLKRMSSDDRDRMMRSRALPEEFPLLQTLHSYGSKLTESRTSPVVTYSSKHVEIKPIGCQSFRSHVAADLSSINTSHSPAYDTIPFSSPRALVGVPSPISTSADRASFPYMSTPIPSKQSRGNPFSSPPGGRDIFRTQPTSQPSSVPRSLSNISHLSESHAQTYPPLSSEEFSHDPKGLFLHHPDGLSRSLPGSQVGQSPYISTTASPSAQQPYPSPHKPDFSPPLHLLQYKYQMPITPHTAGSNSFPEPVVQDSPEMMDLPQQLSAPPDATTFSTSYLTSATPSSSYPHQAGFLSPKIPGSKDSSFGRWYGHRSRRSCSHPPDLVHVSATAVS
ncbi:hypothetical protein DRE_06939 [Drechslerella stenobrocha 248]|uniref:Homeobox domain-containing protein n=1 Tax=Drechslerella stenobrocha 248 TaxID=1043628 RepID=W7HM72_9PEZI|nr:hypothetical protein DRE_06939 [Drechslerella stenobrocha 248]